MMNTHLPMKQIRPLSHLIDRTSGCDYRVVYTDGETMTLLQMNTSKESYSCHPACDIQALLSKGDLSLAEDSYPAFDEMSLSVAGRKEYARNREVVDKICEVYGPSFVGYFASSRNDALKDIANSSGISVRTASRLVLRYLQSGMSASSLIRRNSSV